MHETLFLDGMEGEVGRFELMKGGGVLLMVIEMDVDPSLCFFFEEAEDRTIG